MRIIPCFVHVYVTVHSNCLCSTKFNIFTWICWQHNCLIVYHLCLDYKINVKSFTAFELIVYHVIFLFIICSMHTYHTIGCIVLLFETVYKECKQILVINLRRAKHGSEKLAGSAQSNLPIKTVFQNILKIHGTIANLFCIFNLSTKLV